METDSTPLLKDVPEQLSDLVPYRCPKCGNVRQFATLRELRLHLQKDHAFQMGFIKPQPPHLPARTNVFKGDLTTKQTNMKQHNLFRSKDHGNMSSAGYFSRSMSTLSSHGSNQNQEYDHTIREDSPLLNTYKAETEVLERELLMAKQSELRNKARSMATLTESDTQEGFKPMFASNLNVDDTRSTGQTTNVPKQSVRGPLSDIDYESRNYARALQNDLGSIWHDTSSGNNVTPPFRHVPSTSAGNNVTPPFGPVTSQSGGTNVTPPFGPVSSTSGVDVKGKLEAMNSEVIKSRLNHWVTSDALYKSQDMLREMEHAVEEKCNEQKGIIHNLLKEIKVKDQQLDETRKEHGKLNKERTRLFDETENLVREADTYNRKLQEELRRRGDVVETLNAELDTLKSRSEQEIRSKESDLQNVKVKMGHLEWERDKMVGEMESLLQQAEADGTILRDTIHDKEQELEAVNTELNSLRWNQHQLLERTMEVYQKAEESQDMMKTVLVAKDDQLRSAMEQIERMKDMQKQLVQESRTMSDQADENTSSLKKLLQLKEDQVREATQQLQFLKQEKTNLEDSSASLAEKAETSTAAIENLKLVVSNKEKDLQTAQGELQNLRGYLQSVADKERVARAKLETFIEDLITRAEKAEAELRTLRSQSSDSRAAIPPPSTDATSPERKGYIRPKHSLRETNLSGDEVTERFSLPKSIPPPKPPRARTSTLRRTKPIVNGKTNRRDNIGQAETDLQTGISDVSMPTKHQQQYSQQTKSHGGSVLQKLLGYIHRPSDDNDSKVIQSVEHAQRSKPDNHTRFNVRDSTRGSNQNITDLPFSQAQVPENNDILREPSYVNVPRDNGDYPQIPMTYPNASEQYPYSAIHNNSIHPHYADNETLTKKGNTHAHMNQDARYPEALDTDHRKIHTNREPGNRRPYVQFDDDTERVLRELNNIPLQREPNDRPPESNLSSHYRTRNHQAMDIKPHYKPHQTYIPHPNHQTDEMIPRWRRSIPTVRHVYRSRNKDTYTQYVYESDDRSDSYDDYDYYNTDARVPRKGYIASEPRPPERLQPRYYENEDGELIEVPRYKKRSAHHQRRQPDRYNTRQSRTSEHDYYVDDPDCYNSAYGRDQPRDYNDDVEVTDDAWDEDEFIYIPQHRPRPGTIGKARESPSIMRPKKIKQRPIKKDKFERFNSNYPTSHKSMTNLLVSPEITGRTDHGERSKRSRSLSPATRHSRQESTVHKESRNHRPRHKEITKHIREEKPIVKDTRPSDNESVSDNYDGYVKLKEEESALKFEQHMDENGILWEDDTLPDVSDSEFDRVSPSGSEAITTKKVCIALANPDTRTKTEKNNVGRNSAEKPSSHRACDDTKRLLSDRSDNSERLKSSRSTKSGILKTNKTRPEEIIGMAGIDSQNQTFKTDVNKDRTAHLISPSANKDISTRSKLSATFRPINPEPKYSSSDRDMTSGGKEVYMHMHRSPVVNIHGSPESLTPSNSIKDTLSTNSPDSLSLNSGNKHIRESLDEALKRISEKYKAKRDQQNVSSCNLSSQSSSIEDKIKSISSKYAKRRQDIITGKGVSNQSSGEINDFLKSRLMGDRKYCPRTSKNRTEHETAKTRTLSPNYNPQLNANVDVGAKQDATNAHLNQTSTQHVHPRGATLPDAVPHMIHPEHQTGAHHVHSSGATHPDAVPYMNHPVHPYYMHPMQHAALFHPRPPMNPKQGHAPATEFAYRFPYFHGYTPPSMDMQNHVNTTTNEALEPNKTKIVHTNDELLNTHVDTRDASLSNINVDSIIPETSTRKHAKPLRTMSSAEKVDSINTESTIEKERNIPRKGNIISKDSSIDKSKKDQSPENHSRDNHDLLSNSMESNREIKSDKTNPVHSEKQPNQKQKLEKAFVREDTFYYNSESEESIPATDVCNKQDSIAADKDNYYDEEFEVIDVISQSEAHNNTSIPDSSKREGFTLDDFREQISVDENDLSELVDLQHKPFTEEMETTDDKSDASFITEGFSMFAEPIIDDAESVSNDFTSNTHSLSDIPESLTDAAALNSALDTRQTFYEKSEKIREMIANSESDYSDVYKMKSSRNTTSSASSQG